MKELKTNRKNLKTVFLATVPVLTGYIVIGMGFGVLLATKGYGIWWSILMSILIYAGSMQYLAIDLLAGGATLITAALTTLLVNARHLFYGISMIDKYKNEKFKPYLIFSLTDETYSLVCNGDEGKPKSYYFLVSLLNQFYWVFGTILGSLIGEFVPIDMTGIEFALTALFITVFVDQWKQTKNHKPALLGLITSVVCLIIFKNQNFLLITMAVLVALLIIFKKQLTEN